MLKIWLFIVSAVIVSFWCDSIENGWKDILPLQSNRQFVETKLGKPTAVKGEVSEYSMDGVFIRVTYSRNGCSGEHKKRIYDVPDDTVIEYTVSFHPNINISSLNYDQKAFYKDTSGDLVNSYSLVNFDAGILVGVFVLNNQERASKIWYWPSKKDSERLSCPK